MKTFYNIKNFEKFITAITISVLISILFIFSIIVFIKNKNYDKDSKVYQSSAEVLDFSEVENTILIVDIDDNNISNSEKNANNIENTNNSTKTTEINKKTESITVLNYYIKVNYQANVVNIYKKGSNGELQPYKVMTCSTGTATPKSGIYSVQSKWVWGTLFGHTPGTFLYGQYVTKIVGNILFHSVPYTAQSKSSLEYDQYDKLGTTASAGCVRLTVRDAKWIFDNMPSGTPVEFYADSNPGPMGKPSTQKISDNIECRNWDPTDPDLNNPWIEYNKKVKEAEEEAKKEKQDKLNSEQSNNINEESSDNKNNIVDNSVNNSERKDENEKNDLKDAQSSNTTSADIEKQEIVEIKNNIEITNDLII